MIENPPIQELHTNTSASVKHRSLLRCKLINFCALLRSDIAFVAFYCQTSLYLGAYDHVCFLRFRFAFIEPLQQLKMFCPFIDSLSLRNASL